MLERKARPGDWRRGHEPYCNLLFPSTMGGDEDHCSCAPDPFIRWQFREDRFELAHWIKAPRVGYGAHLDLLTGCLGLSVLRITGEPPVSRLRCYRLTRHDLRQREWRDHVARALREIRRYLRQ